MGEKIKLWWKCEVRIIKDVGDHEDNKTSF